MSGHEGKETKRWRKEREGKQVVKGGKEVTFKRAGELRKEGSGSIKGNVCSIKGGV